MNKDNAKLINCGNDFYPRFFTQLCEALENGQIVQVYVDCIGHTRNNNVQEIYNEKLVEKYGDKLVAERSDGGFSYSYYYELKM